MNVFDHRTLSEQIGDIFESAKVHGTILIKEYSYDACHNRTYINAVAQVRWSNLPNFHLTDYIRMEIKGSTGDYSRYNASTTACYRNVETDEVFFLHDVLKETYESFGVVSYKIPVQIVCNEETQSMVIESMSMVVQAYASGKVDLSEVSAIYQHQVIRTALEFSLIVAYVPSIGNSPISFVPTLTATPLIESKTMWRNIMKVELLETCEDNDETDQKKELLNP